MPTRPTHHLTWRVVAIACVLLLAMAPAGTPRMVGSSPLPGDRLPREATGTLAAERLHGRSANTAGSSAAPAVALASSPPYWLPVAPLRRGRFSLAATVG